jgi:hypothetical protein
MSEMTPALSDEAWALLGLLHSAAHLGTSIPGGLEQAYVELKAHGLVVRAARGGMRISRKGETALRERYPMK